MMLAGTKYVFSFGQENDFQVGNTVSLQFVFFFPPTGVVWSLEEVERRQSEKVTELS